MDGGLEHLPRLDARHPALQKAIALAGFERLVLAAVQARAEHAATTRSEPVAVWKRHRDREAHEWLGAQIEHPGREPIVDLQLELEAPISTAERDRLGVHLDQQALGDHDGQTIEARGL